jgi:hypothetical protein
VAITPDFTSALDFFCFTPRMKFPVAALVMLLALALAPPLFAGGKKNDKASVTFHTETDATDNPKMIFAQVVGGQTRYFRRMPELSLKDMVSFNPFPSEQAETFGLVFKLKSHAVNRFAAVTTANQGRWLISQVDGHAVDAILIDRQVNDGFIVIWKGVTLADVAILDAELPRTNPENKKKK